MDGSERYVSAISLVGELMTVEDKVVGWSQLFLLLMNGQLWKIMLLVSCQLFVLLFTETIQHNEIIFYAKGLFMIVTTGWQIFGTIATSFSIFIGMFADIK